MRIFFGSKKSWFSLLTRPIRILLISIMALLLLVITIAVVATQTNGKLAVASEVGETLGRVALSDEGGASSADEEKEEEARRGTRGTRETRRTNSRPAPQKKPSVIKRGWNKVKRKIGDLF